MYLYTSGLVVNRMTSTDHNLYLSNPRRESEVKKQDGKMELNDGQFLVLGNFLDGGSDLNMCRESRTVLSEFVSSQTELRSSSVPEWNLRKGFLNGRSVESRKAQR